MLCIILISSVNSRFVSFSVDLAVICNIGRSKIIDLSLSSFLGPKTGCWVTIPAVSYTLVEHDGVVVTRAVHYSIANLQLSSL